MNAVSACNDSRLRVRNIKETLLWLEAKLDILGITRVANVTGLDHLGVPVATAVRPESRLLSVSQGKGLTFDQAQISAIMEAVEAYHAERPPPIVYHGSYQSLQTQSQSAVNPSDFAHGAFTIANIESYDFDWIESRHLFTGQITLCPQALCCLDTTKANVAHSFFNVTTNGLAAGNDRDEALCHALLEVMERDNLSEFQERHADYDGEKLALDTVDNPELQQLLSESQQQKIEVAAWDITGKSQISTFHAAIHDPNNPFCVRIHTGTGSHFAKEIALLKALTEALQARLTVITGMRDDLFPDYYLDMNTTKVNRNLSVFQSGTKPFEACSTLSGGSTFAENVQILQTLLLNNQQMQAYWVDHTKPELNIPVVQVLVPGLRHDHSRV